MLPNDQCHSLYYYPALGYIERVVILSYRYFLYTWRHASQGQNRINTITWPKMGFRPHLSHPDVIDPKTMIRHDDSSLSTGHMDDGVWEMSGWGPIWTFPSVNWIHIVMILYVAVSEPTSRGSDFVIVWRIAMTCGVGCGLRVRFRVRFRVRVRVPVG